MIMISHICLCKRKLGSEQGFDINKEDLDSKDDFSVTFIIQSILDNCTAVWQTYNLNETIE